MFSVEKNNSIRILFLLSCLTQNSVLFVSQFSGEHFKSTVISVAPAKNHIVAFLTNNDDAKFEEYFIRRGPASEQE